MKMMIVSRDPRYPEQTLRTAVEKRIAGELKSLDQWMDACHAAAMDLDCTNVFFMVTEEFGSDRVIYTLKAVFHKV